MGNTHRPPRMQQRASAAPIAHKSELFGKSEGSRMSGRYIPVAYCKYCTLQFPEGAIAEHQNMCHKNPLHIFTSCSNCSNRFNLVEYQQHLGTCEEKSLRTGRREEEIVSTKIDCEFCQQGVEIGVYMDHLRRCPQSPANRHTPCPFCAEKLPSDLVIKHAEFCNKNPENIKVICNGCRKQFKPRQYEIHVKECLSLMKKPEAPMRETQNLLKQSVCLPENECPICLCEIKKSDNVRFLACFHKYHNKCITDWSKKQSVCPICQTKIQ